MKHHMETVNLGILKNQSNFHGLASKRADVEAVKFDGDIDAINSRQNFCRALYFFVVFIADGYTHRSISHIGVYVELAARKQKRPGENPALIETGFQPIQPAPLHFGQADLTAGIWRILGPGIFSFIGRMSIGSPTIVKPPLTADRNRRQIPK